jgi:3',5'-cyclic AMP phosphodiesterase CpdA
VLTLAHLSDLHIGQDTEGRALRRAQQVVDHLNAIPGEVDGVLVTGDLADHGTADEYRAVRELLATLRFPVLTCPGNHDERVAYETELLGVEPTGGAPVNAVHRLGGVTIAMCDSTIPGLADGHLADETLTWLDKVLADTEDPALVCFHHPPVKLHIPFVDDIRQQGAERLAEVVSAHENVRAVLCGHAHTGATTTFAGKPCVVAPGVVSTVAPPWESTARNGIEYGLPPALAYHVLDDENLVTHFRSLPSGDPHLP